MMAGALPWQPSFKGPRAPGPPPAAVPGLRCQAPVTFESGHGGLRDSHESDVGRLELLAEPALRLCGLKDFHQERADASV